ncbi:hypothetical protein F5B18DRAFT_408251 [Nemania serpens]|nr:hypothetical protein F5B18DRAFT_408251 [Nemania serpens]
MSSSASVTQPMRAQYISLIFLAALQQDGSAKQGREPATHNCVLEATSSRRPYTCQDRPYPGRCSRRNYSLRLKPLDGNLVHGLDQLRRSSFWLLGHRIHPHPLYLF